MSMLSALPRSLRRVVLGAAVACAVAALSAGTAAAAITSSNVTSPVGPWYALDSNEVSPDPTVTITGTTNSTAPGTDTVDLRCMNRDNFNTASLLAGGVSLNSSGGFSAVVGYDRFPSQAPCRIQAVPAGWTNTSASLGQFVGPVASVGDVNIYRINNGGPNDGQIGNFDLWGMGPQGVFKVVPVGHAGIEAAYGVSDAVQRSDNRMDYGFALRQDGEIAPTPTRSALMVDGVEAYTMRAANSRVNDSAPGLPRVELSWGLDARGIPTFTEKSDVGRCDDEANCTAFVPIGLRLDRTYTFHADGRIAMIRDVFVSTDGAAHAVQTDYRFDAKGDSVMSFNGSQDVTAIRSQTPPLRFTNGPVSGFAFDRERGWWNGQGDKAGVGRSWRQAPDVIYGIRDRGADTVSTYAFTVPAGGQHVIENAVQIGWAGQQVMDAMLRTEDMWTSPTTTIGFPATGQEIVGNWVWVTGQSQARKVFGTFSTPQVSVNGRAATVAPDGSWSVALPLAAGTNTITATATNTAGTTATASVSVTRTESESAGGQAAPKRAKKLTSGIIARSGKRSITIGGKLTPPAGVSKANACTGWVQVKTMRGTKRLAATWAAVRTDCTWRARIMAPARGSAKVTSRFNGNPYVRPIAASSMRIAAMNPEPVTG